MATRPMGRLGLSLLLLALVAPGAAAKEPAESIRWRRTYGEALREARLRNVPVLVTRHKDT